MHIPVMLNECVDCLVTDPDGIYIDGTLGDGGHATAILKRLSERGRLIGFDRDAEAVSRVAAKAGDEEKRLELIRDNFANMEEHLDRLGIDKVHGVLLDLGVSSNQLESAERGFSFMNDGPLDMRMDQSTGKSAADLVNEASEKELADLIRRYGEDRAAQRIARAIVKRRKVKRIETTVELAEIVKKARGGRYGGIHPATQTFQALRIAVNDELANLEEVLETSVRRTRDGGRIVILTFHSLEDRIVKRFFNRHIPREESLQQGGVRRIFEEPEVRWIWKKPLMASPEETAKNPRARTAKLRAVELRVKK